MPKSRVRRAKGTSMEVEHIPAEVTIVRASTGLTIEVQRTDRDHPHRHMMAFTVAEVDVLSTDRAIIVFGDFKEEMRRVFA